MFDGDSTTVVDVARYTHEVRLSGIDALELGQAFGLAARQSLSTLHYREEVVTWHKVDRYARLVGVIRLALSNSDSGLRQLEKGMAWSYTAYKHAPASLQGCRQQCKGRSPRALAAAGANGPFGLSTGTRRHIRLAVSALTCLPQLVAGTSR